MITQSVIDRFFEQMWDERKAEIVAQRMMIGSIPNVPPQKADPFADIKCDRHTPDKPAEKPVLERVHEWGHGSGGLGKDCNQSDKPIYTPPNTPPGDCDTWNYGRGMCRNDEWLGRGMVTRDKGTGKIVQRDHDDRDRDQKRGYRG